MSLPLTSIIQELEDPTSIVPILKALSHDITNLSGQKSQISHLVSRTINLISSHKPYNKWCGVLVTQILVGNYAVLSENGSKFVNALLKVLETTNTTTNLKLFNATVECLNVLCDEIRGKPTLTREILTPKLPVVIQLYLNNLDSNPCLIISSLCHILSHHPTTFRPFGNKLNAKLIEYIRADFNSYPDNLKHQLVKGFALLPILERNEPENVWANKLSGVVNEIVDTVSIFKDLLDFSQDNEISTLISNQTFKVEDGARLFDFLQIDISEPETLLQISNRVQILLYLLQGFSTTSLNICVKFPIGKIISVVEILFSLNTRILTFKRDVRDDHLKSIINGVIRNIQDCGLSIIQTLCQSFNVSMIPYLNGLLSLLETCVPVKHKLLDSENILANEQFMVNILSTTTKLLNLVELYQEPQQLVRFTDMALLLVEPRSSSPDTSKVQNDSASKKKKNNQAVPMADLLSHGHLFMSEVSTNTNKSVRQFINAVMKRMELPSAQYYKIMRYLIIEAVKSTNVNFNRSIPTELKSLLINAVIYPGFEKVSILPIVSTILGDDPLISVFNNPRFPPLPKLIREVTEQDDEDEPSPAPTSTTESMFSDIVRKRALESTTSESTDKKPKTEDIPTVKLQDQSVVQSNEEPETVLQFKNEDPAPFAAKSEAISTVHDQSINGQITPAQPKPVSQSEPHIQVSPTAEDDSDFEVPSIDINDDSDDD